MGRIGLGRGASDFNNYVIVTRTKVGKGRINIPFISHLNKKTHYRRHSNSLSRAIMQPIGAHACQPGVYRSRDPIPVRTLHFFLQTLTSLHQADFVRGGGVGSGGDGGQPLTEVADHLSPIFDFMFNFLQGLSRKSTRGRYRPQQGDTPTAKT